MDKPTILIVDDEPTKLMVISQLLSASYLMRACKSGEQALRAAAGEPRPDLILLDVMMPGMDGYAVPLRPNRTISPWAAISTSCDSLRKSMGMTERCALGNWPPGTMRPFTTRPIPSREWQARGARRIERLALEVEKAARRGVHADELRGTIERLAAELVALLDAWTGVLPAQAEFEEAGAVNWPQVTDVLARLEPLLATDNTAANDLFEESSAVLIAVFGVRARQLGRQIRDFEYADALRTLRSLRNPVLSREEE